MRSSVLVIALSLSCQPAQERQAEPPAPVVDAAAPKGPVEPTLPGQSGDPAFTRTLRGAAAKRGPDYVPRTHHKHPDGGPKFVNRLILESSPYLLQHAHNPVNWYPWGEAAFARAKALDRPILLSVGYSTCHWCHVMERESFEDLQIAAYINENFVAIKVDREERPDVDDIYMNAVRLLSRGNGGWPMTVVMTPGRAPFFGGTYFPARTGDRGARKGFFQILQELKGSYDRDRDAVVAQAGKVSQQIKRMAEGGRPGDVPGPEALERTAARFAQSFDPVWGGFGARPKFPRPATLDFVLRYADRTGDAQALKVVTRTLTKMAQGGMYDHLGGGFHRYSTDRKWLAPHFEKMLYDNAQLARTYASAYQVTRDAHYATVVRETLDYVLREMTAPHGAFYSATDADSLAPNGESEEGWFFTWTPGELIDVIGAAAADHFGAYYDVSDRGNFEGRSILWTQRPLAEVAQSVGLSAAELEADLAKSKAALYRARLKRPAPILDDKVITAWNGLMISGLAIGGLVLDEPRYVDGAAKAADFLLKTLRRDDGRLLRTYADGQAKLNAYLDDYAFLIQGLLDLYEATGSLRWFEAARALQALQDAHYADAERGGYYTTSDDHETLLARDKPDYDGALPAGNSVAASNLLRLAEYTSDDSFRKRAERVFAALGGRLSQGNTAQPRLLSALDMYLTVPKQVVLVAKAPGADADLRRVLRERYLPNRVYAWLPEDQVAAQAQAVPLVEAKVAQGPATAYVCEKGRCERPTGDPQVLAEQLGKPRPLYPDRSAQPLPVKAPGAGPKPWQYDPKKDQHYHAGHGHWHPGKPPPPGKRK